MKCKLCGKTHERKDHPHYRVLLELHDTGFPTHSRGYRSAHNTANDAEKREYPKGYREMKKIDKSLAKHELAGKNLKSGKIEVSAKVPKKLRREVAMHEEVENKILRKKK